LSNSVTGFEFRQQMIRAKDGRTSFPLIFFRIFSSPASLAAFLRAAVVDILEGKKEERCWGQRTNQYQYFTVTMSQCAVNSSSSTTLQTSCPTTTCSPQPCLLPSPSPRARPLTPAHPAHRRPPRALQGHLVVQQRLFSPHDNRSRPLCHVDSPHVDFPGEPIQLCLAERRRRQHHALLLLHDRIHDRNERTKLPPVELAHRIGIHQHPRLAEVDVRGVDSVVHVDGFAYGEESILSVLVTEGIQANAPLGRRERLQRRASHGRWLDAGRSGSRSCQRRSLVVIPPVRPLVCMYGHRRRRRHRGQANRQRRVEAGVVVGLWEVEGCIDPPGVSVSITVAGGSLRCLHLDVFLQSILGTRRGGENAA